MATNSLLPSYLISSCPFIQLYLPHHNIVCLLPQTDPSALKGKIQKLFSSLHLPLHTILLTASPSFCQQKLFPSRDTSRLLACLIPIWFDPPPQSPCLLLHASKPPFFINASRSLIIIWSRHPDSIPIQCSRHRSSTKWCSPCRCNAKAAVTDTKRLKDTSTSLPDQWALKS
jgi:hypothetical protein